jgi:hypothetical protein
MCVNIDIAAHVSHYNPQARAAIPLVLVQEAGLTGPLNSLCEYRQGTKRLSVQSQLLEPRCTAA